MMFVFLIVLVLSNDAVEAAFHRSSVIVPYLLLSHDSCCLGLDVFLYKMCIYNIYCVLKMLF